MVGGNGTDDRVDMSPDVGIIEVIETIIPHLIINFAIDLVDQPILHLKGTLPLLDHLLGQVILAGVKGR
jgi:hypothetical protein